MLAWSREQSFATQQTWLEAATAMKALQGEAFPKVKGGPRKRCCRRNASAPRDTDPSLLPHILPQEPPWAGPEPGDAEEKAARRVHSLLSSFPILVLPVSWFSLNTGLQFQSF